MATLERIRQRSGLLIVIIGLAMLAFILTDLLGSGNSILAGSANVVGKVNGRSIEIQEFSNRMTEYERLVNENSQQPRSFTRKQLADGVWDQFLREELLEEEYDRLGFQVTALELYERLKNNPNIQNAPVFKDQVSQNFSEGLFQQYVSNLKDNSATDPEAAKAYSQWLDFEKGTEKETQSQKYNKAIEKGLYVPKNLARMEYILNNTSSTCKFVALEYISIPDSTVSVDESDLKKYYNENKEDYETEETRSIEFVVFNIEPSAADKKAVEDDLKALLVEKTSNGDTIKSFLTTEDDSAYVVEHSDYPSPAAFFRKSNIPAPLDSTLFDQEVGFVKGPYEDGNFYRLTKITDIRNLPDSVSARHILISYAGANNGQSNSERPYIEAKALADSLLEAVQADTSLFAAMAKENSDDPGSGAKGGTLDWFDDRRMVKPFSDFCFQNAKGDIAIVPSQFGFHIIEILNQGGSSKAIELMTVSREFSASDETFDNIYNEASAFASEVSSMEEFSAKAREKGYVSRPLTNLGKFEENVPGLGLNRDLIKWTYNEETKIGDIQLISHNNDSYVVAILTDAADEGYRSFESVKDEIRPSAIKAKKAEILKAKFEDALKGSSDINAVATAVGAQVKDQVTTMSSSAITIYGTEPKVIGAMCSIELNKLSAPIEGNKGVYVVTALNRLPASDLPDYANEQTKLQNSVRPRVAMEVFNSLKDAARIKDRRAAFY